MMNYEQAIALLTSKGRFFIDLGLDRIKSVLGALGNPQEDLKCIQVAGTNGKGSVCAILSSILTVAGYKTGLFTSPHIFEYTERIKINEEEITKDSFCEYVELVTKAADTNNVHLTEFEILTVVMFKYFFDNNVDVVVLETGLGGRLDATNVISKNLCSVITHIDLDHTDRLGDSKEKISYEKAGIIKPKCPIITSEGYEAIRDKADAMDSMMLLVNPYVEPIYLNSLTLKGIQQRENLALAIAVISLLFKDINEDTIIKGLKKVKHICRFQYIKEKNLIVDGSHNPNGIRVLNENLNLYYPDKKKRFIFGCLKNKDYKRMIADLFSFEQYEDNQPEIYFYSFKSGSSCTFEELRDECIYFARNLKSIDDVSFSEDVLTIICGSFYMLNELIKKEWVE